MNADSPKLSTSGWLALTQAVTGSTFGRLRKEWATLNAAPLFEAKKRVATVSLSPCKAE